MSPDAKIYFTSAFITGISAFILCVVVYLRAQQRQIAGQFAWYTLSIGIWATFVGFATSIDNRSLAYFFSLVCHTAALFIPVTFLHFVQLFTGNRSKFVKRVIWVGYLMMFLLAAQIVIAPALFISSVSRKLGFYFFPDPGPTYHLWVIFFTVFVLYAHWLLLTEALKLRRIQRRKILAFLVGNLIGYVGGAGAFLPVYSINIFPFPYGIWGVFFFSLITAYAVLRLKLIDLASELKKTIVFAGILSFVFAMFTIVTFFMRDVIEQYLGVGRALSLFITVFLVTLFYDPIRHYLTELTDRFLFQKKFNYQKILKDASRGLSQIENLRHLLGLVVHFMTMKARIERAAVYIRNKESEDFLLQYERGYGENRTTPRIQVTSAIVRFFENAKEALDIERIEIMKDDPETSRKWTPALLASLIEEMNILGAAACVPTYLGGMLRYFLILGPKKSGDSFTAEDLNLLYTLAQESAIAIENARLYDEALKKNMELQNINWQLNEASHKLQNALTTTERANKMLQDTQALLIHEQKMATLGRLASSVGHEVNNPLTVLQMNINRMVLKYRKDPELKVQEIAEFFPKMEANVNRIKAVVNTLTGLLKKHEKGKMEPLSLKLLLEETLPLVQFQTYLDNLTGTNIVFNIPGDLPLIKGDLERLQEVFLNIFINAFQALSTQLEKKIEIECRLEMTNPKMVVVKFKDNGCGMSDETLKQIFNYRFTTKPEGKGSGLGLYIVKYIIELHGGNIQAESKLGEGTVFTVRLPVYEEHESKPAVPNAI